MKHPTEGQTLLKIPEAAARLGVSRATVYRLIDSGDLDTVTVSTPRTKIRAGVGGRLYMHKANAWTNPASYGIEFCGGIASHDFTTYPDKAAARRAERDAIREQRPLINRHHNPTRWVWVDGEYVMHPDTEAEVARLRGIVRAKVTPEGQAVADALSVLIARDVA